MLPGLLVKTAVRRVLVIRDVDLLTVVVLPTGPDDGHHLHPALLQLPQLLSPLPPLLLLLALHVQQYPSSLLTTHILDG